jgi:rRNA small subunit pseudouridine methyltransferase Nep1
LPLTIILAECGIELIPDDIMDHPAVQKNLKDNNYASRILDNALHHSAMKRLEYLEKRGRPDIAHICLLNSLGSPLNITGNLRLYVHTVQNEIFEVNPQVRIARNYDRFKGLMAKLLIEGKIQTENLVLFSKYNGNLNNLIDSIENPDVALCSTKGKLVNNYQEIFPHALSKNAIFIIGGFQKGNYSTATLKISNNRISISESSLDAWVVVNKIISFYEIRHNIS